MNVTMVNTYGFKLHKCILKYKIMTVNIFLCLRFSQVQLQTVNTIFCIKTTAKTESSFYKYLLKTMIQ